MNNNDINFNYDLDYSKDKNIDKRILEVCAIAEAKYLEKQKKQKSNNISHRIDIDINNLIKKNNDKNIFINKETINEIKKDLETSNSNVQNASYFTVSKMGKIDNKSISTEKNLLSQRFFAKHEKPLNKNQKINYSSISRNQNNDYNNILFNHNNIDKIMSKSQNNYYKNNANDGSKTQYFFNSQEFNHKINFKPFDTFNSKSEKNTIQQNFMSNNEISTQQQYILNEKPIQRKNISNNISTQQKFIQNEFTIKRNITQNDMSMQRQNLPNDMPIQNQYMTNNLLTQRKNISNDISNQRQYIQNDISTQNQYMPNNISTQRKNISNDMLMEKQYIPNDISIQRNNIPNDISVQNQYIQNNMSLQRNNIPNDISVQKQYIQNNMSLKRPYIPNDMLTQKQYIQNDMPIQNQYIQNDMPIPRNNSNDVSMQKQYKSNSIQNQYMQNDISIPRNNSNNASMQKQRQYKSNSNSIQKQYIQNDMSIQKNNYNDISVQKQYKSNHNSMQKQYNSQDNTIQRRNKSKNKSLLNKIIQKDFKSNEKQEMNKSMHINYKPLFSDSINKKYIFGHDKHISNRNPIRLNKILLQAQTLIKNHKYTSAYYLLQKTIATGEYHSDLFYLYGEVNRILENYKIAEDYLLLALNFEIHSPYVFYSMGLLYHTLKEYQYSNIFLKLFHSLINNDKVHLFIAKNYMGLGELTKAAKELTKAIDMSHDNDNYYKIRSEVYNKMGLTEMSNEDLNMYNYIKKAKIEENK